MIPAYERGRDFSPLSVKKAEGCYFWDNKGKRYLDFSSQSSNVNVGHGRAEIVRAIARQSKVLSYVSPLMWTEAESEFLSKLFELLPSALMKCGLFSSGSEAVEAAVKIAKQYTGGFKLISRWNAYHGATSACTSLTGFAQRRTPFEPLLPGVIFVPPPYCYRCMFGLKYPDCAIRCVEYIRSVILAEGGSERVAAVIAEPIMAPGGVIIPPKEYWPRLREITAKHHVLLIADEAITGFGRTGKWFAFQHWNVVPDILILAKGITSGYMPLSATVVNKEIAGYFEDEPFMHFHTTGGLPISCAAASANIDVLRDAKLIEHAAAMEKPLKEAIASLSERHKSIGEGRVFGLMAAIELVRNKDTKEPFGEEDLSFNYRKANRDHLVAERVVAEALRHGVLMSAFKSANIIKIMPPLCVTEEQIAQGIGVLDPILDKIDQMCA